ncbi:MAG: T9SS type A sorting domain-containing protein [Bacteroidota bacterium]
MKKVLLTIAAAISLNVGFSQKTVDWSIDQVLSPTELQSTTNSGTAINVRVVMKNNGSDSVLVGDSIWYQWAITDNNGALIGALAFPNTNPNQYAVNIATKNMGVNDTVHYVGNFTTQLGVYPSANVRFFFRAHALNRKRGLGFEATQTNNVVANPIVWYNVQRWPVSVNGVNADAKVSVYPNPASNNVNINLGVVDFNAPVKVSIIDVSGREVATENFNASFENISMNTSSLEKGIYIVKVMNGSIESTTKLVVE